ncbi:putative bifunctional diguanylate cyclase/phosphodiesterase [Novosphingobium sp.]|uniref:putative bifunctional diguanylate cyclase/phosphodiesterase n=1 Tax=Novosphingobium sp. TaxID=1874826 RepID=UPI0035B03EB3
MRLALKEVGAGKVVATLLISLVAISLLLAVGFRASTGFVDRLDQQREQQLVGNYIERQAQASIAQLKVQLTWDDAFRAMGRGAPDSAWTDAYIGEFLWTNFGYERLYVVDPGGRALRSWERGRPASDAGYAWVQAQVQRELVRMGQNGTVFGAVAGSRQLADTAWPLDARGRPLTRWGYSLVRIGDRPAVLSVVSILPDDSYGLLTRTPNHLVAVRMIDAAYLQGLSADLMLPGVSLAKGGAQDGQRNSLPLIRGDGRTVGWLEWHTVLRSEMVRDRIRPLFLAYLIFLVALLLGGANVIKMLRTAMHRLRLREAQALHEARHDEMTGLPNRSYFITRLDQELTGLVRRKGRAVAVAFLDFDHFKFINDTLGHPAGDALVRQVADRARRQLPATDLIARLGGDEFVVLRRGAQGQGGISQLGQDLMALFAAPFNIDGRIIDVTASCGISWAPEQGLTAEDLLRNADIALFRAKQRGRGRWRAFTREMEGTVRRRLLLELELRKALQANSLSLAYQPVVASEDGRICGAEALLRWDHPELGSLSPALFVPVAEQAGLMPLLGWWIIGRVFEQRRAWPDVEISINLSPLQLSARGFLDDLAVLVRELRVDPRGITFEVTEGVLMERGTGVFAVLEGLKAMGFGVALDDFGTGYSSLSYLRAFEFDRIKIDRSFVQNIENDLNAHAILKAIVALGQSLDTLTVAEGVETPLQSELVRAAGCELIQGFLFHRPMSAAEFGALLAECAPTASAARTADQRRGRSVRAA